MTRFSLKDHFTWMIIAGVVITANGVIQSVGGTQPLGFASLAMGVLLIGLGIARPRAMSRDRSAPPAPAATTSTGAPSRLIRPIGFLLIVAALVLAVVSGLPAYFRDGTAMPAAATVAMWTGLGLGIALLAFDWQRHRPSGRRSVALFLGVVIGLLTVCAATTSVVRTGVVAVWSASHPAQTVLVFALDAGGDQAPSEALLAEIQGALTKFLEASGQFHPPERVGDGNLALLLAETDSIATEELPDIISAGYLGFHLVHDDSDSLAVAVTDGASPPDGYRLIATDSGPLLIASDPVLTGADIVDQNLSSGTNGEPIVTVRFNDASAARLAEITAANIGRRMAVVSRGRAIIAPTIQGEISDGNVQIAGGISSDDAFNLVRALYLGGLPAPLVLVSQDTIDQ